MTLKAKGRIYRTKQGKCYLYIPKELHTDSQWPYKEDSALVDIEVHPLTAILVIIPPEEVKGGET